MSQNRLILYDLADIFQMPISTADGVHGRQLHKREICGIEIPFDIRLEQDYLLPDEVGAFMQFKGNLWAYVVSGGEKNLHLWLFDGQLVGLSYKDLHRFATGKKSVTLKKIAAGVVAQFRYSPKKKYWEQVDVAMDEGNGIQDSPLSDTSP